MDLILERLAFAETRLEILTRTETGIHAQFLELMDLREQLREAQVTADLQNATRTFGSASVVIAAVA